MTRPVTLFTGQWADLPLEELTQKAASWGFDGLELACWGDYFEVLRALMLRFFSWSMERQWLIISRCLLTREHLSKEATAM